MTKKYILINSLGKGGAERQVSIIAKYLKIDGIIVLEGKHELAYDFGEVPVIKLTNRSPFKSISNTLFIPFYVWRLAKIIPEDSIIISFLERANFVNILLKFFKRTKAIVAEITYPSLAFKREKSSIKLLIRVLYPYANIIIPNSYGSKLDLFRNFNVPIEKIRVVYNAYDLANIENLSKKPLSLQSGYIFSSFPVIITVGRLTTAKAHWNLLKIYKSIKDIIPNIKLVIIGDGELRDYLIDYAKKLSLKTYTIWDDSQPFNEIYDVYFLGIQDNPFQFLSHSELFVFTSLWEGLPNVVIESLICSIPVASTDCASGPSEILAKRISPDPLRKSPLFSDYGVLMPLEPDNNWPKTIFGLLNNKALKRKYSIRAKRRAKDFSIEKIIKEWKDVIINT